MSIFSFRNKMSEQYQKRINKISYDIAACLRGSGTISGFNIVLIAYLLYKASKHPGLRELKYQEMLASSLDIAENIVYYVREILDDSKWEKLKKILTAYTAEEFAMLVSSYDVSLEEKNRERFAPISVNKLAGAILNISQGDKVADICCGSGSFLSIAALKEPNARYYGYEINAQNKLIADIRAEVLGVDMSVFLQDAFDLEQKGSTPKFDKIFSNYPFGIKFKNLGNGEKIFENLSKVIPGISKNTSADWLFNALIYNLLADEGKAIGIMTNGGTCNSIDEPIRKYFIEQGMIEAVIALPTRMFNYTNIATTMIVLSKGNKAVRMVDASKICQPGRRLSEFSESDIQLICDSLCTNSEFSKLIDFDELRENNYVLNLSRYLEQDISFDNATVFEDVIKSISRGAPCTASQLDEMVADDVTNMQYLMLANINDGIIDDNLPYLSNIEPKFEKYCLKDKSLIISKNGYPYKIAVALIKNGQKVLASGNLYIIELDLAKVEPYFLKAFFDSEQGQAVLKSISVGAVVSNIGVDRLKKVLVPMPPLSEQQKIVKEYKAALDEIAVIKQQLKEAVNRLSHIYDKESEGK